MVDGWWLAICWSWFVGCGLLVVRDSGFVVYVDCMATMLRGSWLGGCGSWFATRSRVSRLVVCRLRLVARDMVRYTAVCGLWIGSWVVGCGSLFVVVAVHGSAGRRLRTEINYWKRPPPPPRLTCTFLPYMYPPSPLLSGQT